MLAATRQSARSPETPRRAAGRAHRAQSRRLRARARSTRPRATTANLAATAVPARAAEDSSVAPGSVPAGTVVTGALVAARRAKDVCRRKGGCEASAPSSITRSSTAREVGRRDGAERTLELRRRSGQSERGARRGERISAAEPGVARRRPRRSSRPVSLRIRAHGWAYRSRQQIVCARLPLSRRTSPRHPSAHRVTTPTSSPIAPLTVAQDHRSHPPRWRRCQRAHRLPEEVPTAASRAGSTTLAWCARRPPARAGEALSPSTPARPPPPRAEQVQGGVPRQGLDRPDAAALAADGALRRAGIKVPGHKKKLHNALEARDLRPAHVAGPAPSRIKYNSTSSLYIDSTTRSRASTRSSSA